MYAHNVFYFLPAFFAQIFMPTELFKHLSHGVNICINTVVMFLL